MKLTTRADCIGKNPCESEKRKNVMVTVRRDVLTTAREDGLNLSKLLENTLIQQINAENNGFPFSTGFPCARMNIKVYTTFHPDQLYTIANTELC